jgi:uncharacterized linocin/CFP29 family protein
MDKALIQHAADFLRSGGSPARFLATNGLNAIGALRTNDVLRKEEWQQLDETLVGVARQRLIGISDLVSRGLSFNLGGLGVVLSQYEQLGDMTAANVDFSGVTEGEKDSVTFTLVSVPVPIFHKDFSINIRRLEASRGPNSIGAPIDRTQIETAAQKVTEQMEEVLFNGMNSTVGALGTAPGGSVQTGAGNVTSNNLYGYTTHPSINTQAGSSWGTATNPQTDVINVIGVLEGARYFGGQYVLYAPTAQYNKLRNFLTDGSGDQIFDRLRRIQGIEDVRPGDRLTSGTGVMVTMRRDVVDLAIGQDLTVVEWETKGGLMLHFKVMAALAPRVKSDAAAGSGICTVTGIS